MIVLKNNTNPQNLSNIYLVCSASDEGADVWGGLHNLSDKGIEECQKLKKEIAFSKSSLICSSLQKQAQQTAYLLSLTPVIYSDLFNEINFGIYENESKEWDDMFFIYHKKLSDLEQFSRGDNPESRAMRFATEIAKLSGSYVGKDIVIFTHKTLIECLQCLILGKSVDNRELFEQEIKPCSVSHIVYDNKNHTLDSVKISQYV